MTSERVEASGSNKGEEEHETATSFAWKRLRRLEFWTSLWQRLHVQSVRLIGVRRLSCLSAFWCGVDGDGAIDYRLSGCSLAQPCIVPPLRTGIASACMHDAVTLQRAMPRRTGERARESSLARSC